MSNITIPEREIKKGAFAEWRKISRFAFEVYSIVVAFSEDGKTASVSLEELSKLSELSHPTIQKTINELIDAKVLKRKKRGKNANLYEF